MCTPAAFAIAPLINANSTLVHLSLSGNQFNDKAAEPLADVIRGSYHIKFLDLSHNEFGEDAGLILGPAIGKKYSRTLLLTKCITIGYGS